MVPEDLLFWIGPLEVGDVADRVVLCRRHADAMVVPRGWTLDDRREAAPRLFRPKGADDTASLRRPRRRRTDAAPAHGIAQQLDFAVTDDVTDGVTDHVPDGVRPDEPGPWRPAFDPDDDLDGLLEVDSPLLARAFRGAGRRRA